MPNIPKEFKRASYAYHLPQHLIATHPINPKENAKLMVYERASDRLTHTTFKKIFDFFPKDALVVLNDTKVMKARLFAHTAQKRRVEILLHHAASPTACLAQVRGKVRPGLVLELEQGYSCEVLEVLNDGLRVLGFRHEGKPLEWAKVLGMLELLGHMPIPPYLKRPDTSQDTQDYQSVFAKNLGAIAAPTASLHFSQSAKDHLLKNFKHVFITLHVGAGTFLSVQSEDIREHPMHAEFVEVSFKAGQALDEARYILCVGTTALRATEHYKRGLGLEPCNLFLHPGNPVRAAQALLTNFHLPESTLIMLVASMVGLDKCLELYKIAIEHHYRFYSYGDGMLIL
ncbi:tRNA preQ1(34) S-adenosylmethionine ribosyltransferase-isomerase QueA [Helicobacter ailurogastricus]|uniref:S-adenosylmethionine:tRNA ribosyltransferase-isomerase n=1 Tax=Helicobacter ailurogastricus TaxID=1578720 RepID=A0A0K2Y356_9HELI|nr:tRNA preQ1(34) S-adenosylmethionine ribosyltransferase-isomerase QueA [Helicobacter ailurogastricus]BDQ28893.1 S-adenosylmethionine:tRNA ribosyltransferase-isomerase [Helicobacter ailurogastricus]CRI32411.1 S-adenosylmethionine:tRNA ribosyltransferase-isomerase [Helicobacter ailurogastricus]